MECIAVTSISPEVIDELKKGIPRTIELMSAHNVIALSKVGPGNQVFMTTVACEDITIGDVGILVEVISIAITMKHMIGISQGYQIMEKERMSARCKVRYISNTTIKRLSSCRLTEPRVVDIVRPAGYRAG